MKKIIGKILCFFGIHHIVDIGGGTLSFPKVKCLNCGKRFMDSDYGLIDDNDEPVIL